MGKCSNLTNIFQSGWNHHLVDGCRCSHFDKPTVFCFVQSVISFFWFKAFRDRHCGFDVGKVTSLARRSAWHDESDLPWSHFRTLDSPKTNSSPLKMDGWKPTFLLGRPIFRFHDVSFWVCRWCSCYVTTCCLPETKVEPTIQRCLQTWLADSPAQRETWPNNFLGGGLKYFIFSALLGEMIQIDEPIFSNGWFNHQLVLVRNKHGPPCFNLVEKSFFLHVGLKTLELKSI